MASWTPDIRDDRHAGTPRDVVDRGRLLNDRVVDGPVLIISLIALERVWRIMRFRPGWLGR
jgi:hypothetical protein